MIPVALALVACGGSREASPGGQPPSTAGTTTTATTTTTAADPLAGAGTDPVTAPASATATALLERIAVGRHEGYDRVVFQFRNHTPGFRVDYVEPPFEEDGSGNPVDVAGTAFVRVRMEAASGFDLNTGEGELVYKGPRRIEGADADASVVKELVRTGDFEAVLTWVIGLDERVDFRVQTLADPPRLVVDFRSH